MTRAAWPWAVMALGILLSLVPNAAAQSPVADFSWSPDPASTAGAIHFTDLSADPGGTIVSWGWTFGDGSASTLQNPDHQYTTRGAYEVRLSVRDDDGNFGNVTKILVVGNAPPVAQFSFTFGSPGSNENVTFRDESTDPDGSIVDRAWDFGDGQTSTEAQPFHAYESGGAFTVTLTVHDNEGAAASATQAVVVTRTLVGGAGAASPGSTWWTDPVLVGSVAGAVVAVGFCAWLWRRWDGFRWRWLLVFAPLFSRFAKSEILESGMRETIYGYIESNPGAHLRAIQRDLRLRNGTLLHHLQMLQTHGFIKSARDGMYRRYFVVGAAPRFQGNEETAQRVLKAVRATPGITASQIAETFGVRRSLIHYHVQRLAEEGRLRKEGSGRNVFLFLVVPGAPDPTPVWAHLNAPDSLTPRAGS